MKVRATATQVGRWWALSVEYGAGLSTQVRHLRQAEAMVADAVASVCGVPSNEVDVDVEVRSSRHGPSDR